MDYTNTLKTLQEASAFDLFRLRAAIDRVLDQPGWMQAVQSRPRAGQSVQYFDPPVNWASSQATRASSMTRTEGLRYLQGNPRV